MRLSVKQVQSIENKRKASDTRRELERKASWQAKFFVYSHSTNAFTVKLMVFTPRHMNATACYAEPHDFYSRSHTSFRAPHEFHRKSGICREAACLSVKAITFAALSKARIRLSTKQLA
jgi:hypothetical protein